MGLLRIISPVLLHASFLHKLQLRCHTPTPRLHGFGNDAGVKEGYDRSWHSILYQPWLSPQDSHSVGAVVVESRLPELIDPRRLS